MRRDRLSNAWMAAWSYAMALLMAVTLSVSGDPYFGFLGLVHAALGAWFLDSSLRGWGADG